MYRRRRALRLELERGGVDGGLLPRAVLRDVGRDVVDGLQHRRCLLLRRRRHLAGAGSLCK